MVLLFAIIRGLLFCMFRASVGRFAHLVHEVSRCRASFYYLFCRMLLPAAQSELVVEQIKAFAPLLKVLQERLRVKGVIIFFRR